VSWQPTWSCRPDEASRRAGQRGTATCLDADAPAVVQRDAWLHDRVTPEDVRRYPGRPEPCTQLHGSTHALQMQTQIILIAVSRVATSRGHDFGLSVYLRDPCRPSLRCGCHPTTPPPAQADRQRLQPHPSSDEHHGEPSAVCRPTGFASDRSAAHTCMRCVVSDARRTGLAPFRRFLPRPLPAPGGFLQRPANVDEETVGTRWSTCSYG
jgi:hypothetical protein